MLDIFNVRVPQPDRYAEYGVPAEISKCVDVLYAERNAAPESVVLVIDGVILRLLEPWTKDGSVIEDLGSITAIDTGFDVRTHKMPAVLPLKPGVKYRLAHQTRHEKSTVSVSIGTAEEICQTVLMCGYAIQIPLPNGRHIAAVLKRNDGKAKVQFEVQPHNDNYWLTVTNLSQALVAYERPELYRE